MIDDSNVDQIHRSWQTRLQSVGRQFAKLAERPVLDTRSDQMVHIAGLFLLPTPGGATEVRVNVCPTDRIDDMYSTGIEFLEM
jgi:hypothetical protein